MPPVSPKSAPQWETSLWEAFDRAFPRPESQTERVVGLSDLWIQTKDNRLVPFTPNEVQARYLDEIAPSWRQDDYRITGLREIVLKARQFGFSTLILALLFLDTVNRSNVNTVVIADDAENTEAMFQIVHRFYENLPDAKKPRKRYGSKREFAFADTGSTFRVLTAGKGTAGRSRTIHNLHCSEVAFWPDETVFTGLLQAVPAGGNVFVETTANGEGNAYHTFYQDAKKGRSEYKPRFFAWFTHSEYKRAVPQGFTRDESEGLLAEKFGLSDEQLAWRRAKRSEPGMGNLFAQEYPSDDREAFLVSGQKFFTEWDEDKHIIRESEWEFQAWHKWEGALDWGYGKPFAFLLGCLDGWGGVVIAEECYGARILNRDQAERIKEAITRRGIEPKTVLIHADPSMWNVKTRPDGIGYRDIDDYYNAGLNMVKAVNMRTSRTASGGWSNVRQYMADVSIDRVTGEEYPALRVVGEWCPNTVRTIPQMIHAEHNPEDMDSDKEDHCADCLRYLLNAHLRPSLDPNAPKPEDPRRIDQSFLPHALRTDDRGERKE